MRYLPHTQTDRAAMLQTIGIKTEAELYRDAPADKVLSAPIAGLPLTQSEMAVEKHFVALAAQNMHASAVPFFCGAGVYKHHVPATVDYMIQRGEFLTSYTPYQPEVSQGTLKYLFEFQTQVSMLTGLPVANASMYDGSTAAAEAVAMAGRITKRGRALVSGTLHPHYADVIKTTAHWTGYDAIIMPPALDGSDDFMAQIDDTVSCVVVQNPSFYGHVRDLSELAAACHKVGALLIVVVTEIISLGLLTPPGAMGADIVVGEGQSIGNGMNFGGPHVGLFACKTEHIRQMPGRVCGETVDADGKRGFVLTLSTREQHIRRDKATSNICTNAGLCALAFTIHLSLLGETGLTHLAQLNHARAVQMAEQLASIKGVEIINDSFFNEFTVRLPRPAADVVEQLAAGKILAGVPVSRLLPHNPDVQNLLLVAVTETVADADMHQFVTALAEVLA